MSEVKSGGDLFPLPEIKGRVLLDEPMSAHTSFKIGGPADIFVTVENVSDLQAVLKWAEDNSVSAFVLGAGTNLLVSDKGVRGVVISFGCGIGDVFIRGTEMTVGASAKLAVIVRKALGLGLCGLEGLAGIPGTVGGAICMNAGTPVGCVGDSLKSVKALTADNDLVELSASALGLSYRRSRVREKGLIVLEAVFTLRKEDPENLQSVVGSLLDKRKVNQPAGTGTAGSVFRNPTGVTAGELLDKAGAKGMQVGGARVSSKHANWIENTGIATASDVKELMNKLQALVKEKFDVALEPEIQMVGEWK